MEHLKSHRARRWLLHVSVRVRGLYLSCATALPFQSKETQTTPRQMPVVIVAYMLLAVVAITISMLIPPQKGVK